MLVALIDLSEYSKTIEQQLQEQEMSSVKQVFEEIEEVPLV